MRQFVAVERGHGSALPNAAEVRTCGAIEHFALSKNTGWYRVASWTNKTRPAK
jgi:hypothetical protein